MSAPLDSPPFLTVARAAGVLDMATGSLDNMRSRGDGPDFVRMPNGQIRYLMSALADWACAGNRSARERFDAELGEKSRNTSTRSSTGRG